MANDLTQYPHSMHDDPITGKPTQKTAARIIEASIQMPVEIQSRRAQTIQTHNAVSAAATSMSYGAWTQIDANGAFDEIALTASLSASSNNGNLHIQWSFDGSNAHGNELVGMTTSLQTSATFKVKAPYFRSAIYNNAATSITANVWAYLKA